MKKYEIDEKLANELLNYLAQKPYLEVFQLVAAIQRLGEIRYNDDDGLSNSVAGTE